MPSFWTSDAEMVSVALMSDPGGRGELAKDKTKAPTWAKLRLGQTIVLLELLGKMKSIREEYTAKQDSGMVKFVLPDVSFSCFRLTKI